MFIVLGSVIAEPQRRFPLPQPQPGVRLPPIAIVRQAQDLQHDGSYQFRWLLFLHVGGRHFCGLRVAFVPHFMGILKVPVPKMNLYYIQ